MRNLFRRACFICDRVAIPVAFAFEGLKLLSRNFGDSGFCSGSASGSVIIGGVACMMVAGTMATGRITVMSSGAGRSNYQGKPRLG